jgi:hypothetical protein
VKGQRRATRTPKPRKTITLTAYDAEHVYDWLRMYWCDEDQRFGGCPLCEQLGRRLERLVGPAWIRRVSRFVNADRRKRGLGPQLTPEN